MNFTAVNTLIDQAIEDQFFPAASLLIHFNEKIVHEYSSGSAQLVPESEVLTKEHLFDIASLTKPMVTSSLMMITLQKKLATLENKIGDFFPEAKNPEITISQLLQHHSGLPAWKPYYKNFTNSTTVPPSYAKEIINLSLQEELQYPTGSQVIYSDIGFIILGAILEKIWNQPLEIIFKEQIATPLQLTDSIFQNQHHSFPFVATEECPWRKQIVKGGVHDDNAAVMGGIAGHAGLFSTCRDIHTWLNELKLALQNKSSIFSTEIVKLFLKIPQNRNPEKIYFTLGFDTPSKNSSTGHFFSPFHTVGHLGYSGCSFWWEQNKDLMVILLTNRVHPSRKNKQIIPFRPQLHDTIFKTLCP